METNRVINADAFEVLPEFPDESVHAVVCDPPYALGDSGFMGRDWDNFSDSKAYQKWCESWAEECRRVLKPGGHLLAFGGNTRHHRLNVGVEDAGFEIRDTLTWHYGSGFPKASDISKTIDKRADAEREVVGEHPKPARNDGSGNSLKISKQDMPDSVDVTAPATDAAKKWDGWKTGLKPATEYIVMARKPFDGATVDCVLEHGTGALNIDETRIESDGSHKRQYQPTNNDRNVYSEQEGFQPTNAEGRYPSNVIFDEIAGEQLDQEVGETHSPDTYERASDSGPTEKMYGDGIGEGRGEMSVNYGDSGGPSRYFYTSKASKAERTENGKIENSHPTVKPIDLMEWLIKLVTKEEQIVLDPFCGSGTTLKACKGLNREFVGIEKQANWADVARVRVGLTPNDPSVVRSNDDQSGLEQY